MNEYRENTEEAAEQPEVIGTSQEETAKEKPAREKKNRVFSGRGIVQLMNGEFLTRDYFLNNLPFTFFVGFLLVCVIAWGYYGETIAKKEIQLEKELDELNSEYYTLAADYNHRRRRRQIALKLEETGVKESSKSPKKLRVHKYVFP